MMHGQTSIKIGTCLYFLYFRAATFLAQLDPEDGDPVILQNVVNSLPISEKLNLKTTAV